MAKRYKTSREKRASQRRYRRKRQQYENYKDQFERRKENFEKRGLEFYEPAPLTYRDWKTVYQEKYNDLKIDIKEGKRKTIGDVNREIVSDQAYELSSKQAEVLGNYLLENQADLLEELNLVYKYTDADGVERINLKKRIDLFMKIRQGELLREDVGLWDMINDFRANLFNMSDAEKKAFMEKYKGRKDIKTFTDAVKAEVGQTFFDSPK